MSLAGALIAEHSALGVVLVRSRDLFVVAGRIGYDSMPLAVAAYGLQRGRKRGLQSDDVWETRVIRCMDAFGSSMSGKGGRRLCELAIAVQQFRAAG